MRVCLYCLRYVTCVFSKIEVTYIHQRCISLQQCNSQQFTEMIGSSKFIHKLEVMVVAIAIAVVID